MYSPLNINIVLTNIICNDKKTIFEARNLLLNENQFQTYEYDILVILFNKKKISSYDSHKNNMCNKTFYAYLIYNANLTITSDRLASVIASSMNGNDLCYKRDVIYADWSGCQNVLKHTNIDEFHCLINVPKNYINFSTCVDDGEHCNCEFNGNCNVHCDPKISKFNEGKCKCFERFSLFNCNKSVTVYRNNSQSHGVCRENEKYYDSEHKRHEFHQIIHITLSFIITAMVFFILFEIIVHL